MMYTKTAIASAKGEGRDRMQIYKYMQHRLSCLFYQAITYSILYIDMKLHVKSAVFLPLLLVLSAAFLHSAATTLSFRSTLSQPSRLIRNENERRLRGVRSEIDSDFILGALIPVHRSAVNSSGAICGNRLTGFGVQRVEEILYLLDRINSDADLLPNLTLGYDIRDTCLSTNVALGESLSLIVSHAGLQMETCPMAEGSGGREATDSRSFFLGVIGATVSSVSVPVASLFREFMVPQISYLSTSPLLSSRDRYGFFLRTVPADDIQATAMYRLALRFNWTLVAAIHSNDVYGERGIEEFRRLTRGNASSVCIDFNEGMDATFTDAQHRHLAERLVNETRAHVVVLFASTSSTERFLQALSSIGTQRRFTWIVSDAIAPSPLLREQFGSLLVGMFGFNHFSVPFLPFESFFANVTLGDNQRNRIWYEEYCMNLFGNECRQNSSAADSPSYVQDASSTNLVNSVYSFAYGLDRFLKENCAQPVVWNRTSQTCQGQNRTLTRELLLEYVQGSNFQSPTGFRVMFDENGFRESLYSIFNLQRNGTSGYTLPMVGTYDPVNGSIQFNTNRLQFGPIVSDREQIQSQCRVCDPGSIFMPVQGSCCGTCHPCLGNTTTDARNGTSSATTCSKCGLHQWGNEPLNGSTSCQSLEESFISYSDVWGAIIIVLSILGLLLVIAVCIGMGIFWNTPVIKSSGREQMVVLLIGLICCFLLPYFYIIKPSLGICIVQRLGLWFCFPLVFGALLVKLIRIARIFLQRQKAGRPRFIEPHYQIIFTIFIVAGQVVLAVISLIVVHPNTTINVRSNPDDSNDFPTLILTCQPPHLVLLILLVLYDTTLIILNNILAILTIRFPENFNEARHVSFSTFAIGVVWLGFIPSYFATQIEFRAGVVGFGVLITAYAVLLCLFGPRVIVAIQQRWKKSHSKKDKEERTHYSSHDSETAQTSVVTEYTAASGK